MPRLILFVLLAGVVIYGAVWLSMRLRESRRAGRAGQRPAPDDDPAFLAQLDRRLAEQRRQAERERRRLEAEAAAAESASDGTGPNDRPAPSDEPAPTDEPTPTDEPDVDPDAGGSPRPQS